MFDLADGATISAKAVLLGTRTARHSPPRLHSKSYRLCRGSRM
jgi:hypothetical protein